MGWTQKKRGSFCDTAAQSSVAPEGIAKMINRTLARRLEDLEAELLTVAGETITIRVDFVERDGTVTDHMEFHGERAGPDRLWPTDAPTTRMNAPAQGWLAPQSNRNSVDSCGGKSDQCVEAGGQTPMKTTIDNTQELRDALFHAYCLLNRFDPQSDNDYSDIAAAHELLKLRDQLNQPTTAKESTRQMIAAAKAKNSGKLGGEGYVDRRKFRRL
jgi:hypothetical protein